MRLLGLLGYWGRFPFLLARLECALKIHDATVRWAVASLFHETGGWRLEAKQKPPQGAGNVLIQTR